MKKPLLKFVLKFGIWLFVRRMRKEIRKVRTSPESQRAYKEIVNAILAISHNVALLYGIDIKIKYIDPAIQKPEMKKEKKLKKERKRKMKRLGRRFRILLVFAVVAFSLSSFAVPPLEAPEPLAPSIIDDIDWEVFSHFAIGIAWDLATGEEHGIAFVSILSYKSLLNLDIGLIDFEQVENEGKQWYDNINPSIGISADVIELMRKLPAIGEFVELIPDIVGIGIGAYIEIGSDYDVIPIMYITARW